MKIRLTNRYGVKVTKDLTESQVKIIEANLKKGLYPCADHDCQSCPLGCEMPKNHRHCQYYSSKVKIERIDKTILEFKNVKEVSFLDELVDQGYMVSADKKGLEKNKGIYLDKKSGQRYSHAHDEFMECSRGDWVVPLDFYATKDFTVKRPHNTLKVDTLEYELVIKDRKLQVGCQTIGRLDALKIARFIEEHLK
jgi:hypothetical protein